MNKYNVYTQYYVADRFTTSIEPVKYRCEQRSLFRRASAAMKIIRNPCPILYIEYTHIYLYTYRMWIRVSHGTMAAGDSSTTTSFPGTSGVDGSPERVRRRCCMRVCVCMYSSERKDSVGI